MFTGGPCAREDACAGGWCVHGPRTRYTMCVLQGMACTLLGHQCVYLSPSLSLSLFLRTVYIHIYEFTCIYIYIGLPARMCVCMCVYVCVWKRRRGAATTGLSDGTRVDGDYGGERDTTSEER